MKEVALALRAVNCQAVLLRTVSIAYRLGVEVVAVSVPTGSDPATLTDMGLVLRADERALDNLVRRLGRVVDIADVNAVISQAGIQPFTRWDA